VVAFVDGTLCLVGCATHRLPDDVAVVDAVAVPPDFHPQENVERKLYSYRVCHGRKPAIGRQYCWALPRALPPDAATLMRGAAAALLGRHDFTSRSDVTRGGGRAAAAAAAASATRGYVHGGAAAITAPAVSDDGGSVTFDNVRTLFAVEVVEESRDTLRVDMEASAFTRGMARNIVGLLVDVATGRCSSDSVPAMLAARCRASAGAGAPASGLCLEWIRYATAASTACGGGVSCDGDGGASRDGDGVASCEDGGGT
jgi:tRNA pseudouridine38-40 synthase